MTPVSIMIAEDEPLTREGLCSLVSERLSERISLVIPVSNGLEALEKLEQIPVDILLTDISMPEMDGIKLIEKVDERYPDIVKIIISGYDDFNFAKRSLKFHVLDYLLKPVEPQELISALVKGAEAAQTVQEDRRRNGLIDMHSSGKLSFLYTSNFIKDLIVGVKSKNKNTVREIAVWLSEYLDRQSGELSERKHIAHWIISTFFACCPELKYGQIDEKCQVQIGKCQTAEEINSVLEQLFLQCSEHFQEKSSSQKKLDHIKAYIAGHFSEEISLQMLSDRFGLTPTYICDLFTMFSEQTYRDFLQKVRISQAVQLLEKTDLKIYEIAKAAGYNNANYFARAFRKVVGMSPNEFRAKMNGG